MHHVIIKDQSIYNGLPLSDTWTEDGMVKGKKSVIEIEKY